MKLDNERKQERAEKNERVKQTMWDTDEAQVLFLQFLYAQKLTTNVQKCIIHKNKKKKHYKFIGASYDSSNLEEKI